jgi:hypothetical protein
MNWKGYGWPNLRNHSNTRLFLHAYQTSRAASRPALGTTLSPLQQVQGALCPGGEVAEELS